MVEQTSKPCTIAKIVAASTLLATRSDLMLPIVNNVCVHVPVRQDNAYAKLRRQIFVRGRFGINTNAIFKLAGSTGFRMRPLCIFFVYQFINLFRYMHFCSVGSENWASREKL